MLSNIPEGYDENGVRNGNGQWEEYPEEEIEQLDIVECLECGAVIDSADATYYQSGFLCNDCAKQLELVI
jgi:hypothetical protein